MSFDYSLVFWVSFLLVTTNSYFIQKKYIFKSNKEKSFFRYSLVTITLAVLEYIISNYFRPLMTLNVFAFLIGGFFIFILRFILNKKFVF
tara:strand:- start:181 stop:450 length:270 start_codon:yes stop_codon:yes gene_type:complete